MRWDKFITAYGYQKEKDDIVVYAYILMHDWCKWEHVERDCADYHPKESLRRWMGIGLIGEENGHYHCG